IAGRAEHRPHVEKVFALDALPDRFDHRALDVLRVHDSIWTDAASEVQCEPAAAGTDVRDDRSIRDAERVHDLLRLLPLVAIRRFEQPEILCFEELPLCFALRGS